jgi:hypothetical protein
MAIPMVEYAGVEKKFWAEAIYAAAHIRNRLPTATTGVSPFELLYGKTPNLRKMKVWGCVAYALKVGLEKIGSKFLPRGTKLRFVGYSPHGYRLWDEENQKILIRADVQFLENQFSVDGPVAHVQQSSDSSSQLGEEDSLQQDAATTDVAVPSSPAAEESLEWAQHSTLHCLYHADVRLKEPATVEELEKSPEAAKWRTAMQKELDSLQEMGTWELVPAPMGKNIVDCKWIFRYKYDENGNVNRYKARLVAKGFSQEYGIDYLETFSPVVRLGTLRTVLAFALQKKMHIHQMDVTTAFLNGYLMEDVYMKQPPGAVDSNKPDHVCKLKRSLYGLKQAPRCWNVVLDQYLLEIGFQRSKKDTCLYILRDPFILLTIYVDDLVMVTQQEEDLQWLKKQLLKKFKMVDMGVLHHILGIKVEQQNNCLHMSQETYINGLLKKYRLEDVKVVSTPANTSVHLQKHTEDSESKLVDIKSYQSMVGSLLYCALGTRPDIQYAVSTVAQFNSQPDQSHLTAVKRIFAYLKGTSHLKLTYHRLPTPAPLIGYCDADFARDPTERKSVSGYTFLMSGGAITWYSGKQKCVSVSTSNAEYIALGVAAREALFLKHLLEEMGEECRSVKIMEDNQPTLAMTQNPVYHGKQKHIGIQHHFIRDEVQQGTIVLEYCPTEMMIADVLTKPLIKGRHQIMTEQLGLHGSNHNYSPS